MKVIQPLSILLICLGLIVMAFGYFYHPEPERVIPTFREIQTMLVNQGYDIGGDGIDGRIGPNTLRAWDSANCDRFYKESLKRMAGIKDYE